MPPSPRYTVRLPPARAAQVQVRVQAGTPFAVLIREALSAYLADSAPTGEGTPADRVPTARRQARAPRLHPSTRRNMSWGNSVHGGMTTQARGARSSSAVTTNACAVTATKPASVARLGGRPGESRARCPETHTEILFWV